MKFLQTLATAAALIALPMSQALAYQVDLYQGSGSIANLAQARTLIVGTPTVTANASVINYDDLQDSTRGHFSADSAFPGGLNNTFAAHVTGNFYLDTAGTWTFGVNADDGASIRIDGLDPAMVDFVHDNQDATITASFAVGLHSVEIFYFENNGGASLEFFGGQGTRVVSNYQLVQSVPEPESLALFGLALAGLAVVRRRKI